MSIAEI